MKKLYDVNGKEVSGVALNKYFDENGNYKGGLYTTSQARAIDEVFTSETSTIAKSLSNVQSVSAGAYKVALIDDYI